MTTDDVADGIHTPSGAWVTDDTSRRLVVTRFYHVEMVEEADKRFWVGQFRGYTESHPQFEHFVLLESRSVYRITKLEPTRVQIMAPGVTQMPY